MKTTETLLAIALATVPLGGMAAASATPLPQQQPSQQPSQQQQQKNPSAEHKAGKNAPPPTKLPEYQPAPKTKDRIERVGKMSSQPWTKIVGWHPGASAFPTGETAEPQLTLLTVNF